MPSSTLSWYLLLISLARVADSDRFVKFGDSLRFPRDSRVGRINSLSNFEDSRSHETDESCDSIFDLV